MSFREVHYLSADGLSLYARDMVGNLFHSLDSTDLRAADVSSAVNYLQNWDYRFTASDIASTIFNAFFLRMLHNTFEDEMGEDVFRDFVFFGAIPLKCSQVHPPRPPNS